MALRNGSRFPVSMHDVFPHGCYLVPDSITEAQDYDEKTKRRTPSVDKVTGKRVCQCRVVGHGPRAGGPVPRDRGQDPGRPDAGPADPPAVRAGGVRGPGRHPVRDRPGQAGASRCAPPGSRPPRARRRRRTRPDARQAGHHGDPAGRCPLGGGVRVLPGPDPAADHHGAPGPACW